MPTQGPETFSEAERVLAAEMLRFSSETNLQSILFIIKQYIRNVNRHLYMIFKIVMEITKITESYYIKNTLNKIMLQIY